MPASSDIEKEFDITGQIVSKYLAALHSRTGRNLIVYYSSFLHAAPEANTSMCDEDMQGFMSAFHKLDKTKGADIILHTPGGSVIATEAIGNYIRSVFKNDIHCYVPHMAMSCGTMLAFACKKIIMGKASSLGPTDPSMGSDRVDAIIEEFERARDDIASNPNLALLWQPILAKKYHLGLYGECKKAKELCEEVSRQWLETGMFASDLQAETKIKNILDTFNSHGTTKVHDRRISIDKALSLGVKVDSLEADPNIQEAVMSLHHCMIAVIKKSKISRCILNQNSVGQIF